MFLEVYHILGTFHIIVTKDFKNNTLGDMIESFNTEIRFWVSVYGSSADVQNDTSLSPLGILLK